MTPSRLGQQVWAVHLALTDAALDEPSPYSMSSSGARSLREDADNREEELALTTILASASPRLPPAVLERARAVARLVWPDEPSGEVDAHVDAWLHWQPDSGVPPPYGT